MLLVKSRLSRQAAAALALVAALHLLAACTAFSTVDTSYRMPSRMRAPSTERPVWLQAPPMDAPKLPAPVFGFRA